MDFFNTVGDGIVDIGKDVAQKAKDTTELARLHLKIKNDEAEIKKYFCKIGKSYYERFKNDENSEYADIMEKITELYENIAECEEDLSTLKGHINCVNCGAKVKKDAKYCPKCGERTDTIIL